ncbi:MAG TPA: DNA polymerase III subunit gamma and tau [Trebonia sp.]
MAEDPNAAQSSTTGGLALYRKYRPATFAEVRGQEHVTEPLRQALKSGRINHAYLFSGPRGCGKTSSARIMARSLNCVNGPTPDPCGVCESCVALAPAGPGSIDVIEIDAASHGGVDDARDLRERAFYAPVSGRYKIYIIDEAHMVTSQGFNALLKLVEEPPPHLKFIFATTEPEKVIATIRSRTHHYPFRLMPPSVMSGLLTDILNEESVSFEPTVIPLVVQAGGGSARDSLSILDQLLAGSDESGVRYDRAVALLGYTDASLLDEIVSAFASGDGAEVFRMVNRVIEGGHEPRRFATDMLDRFRDLIVLATVPDAIQTGLLNVPPDRAETLAGQAKWGVAQLTRAAEIVSAGLDQMRGATSPRLLLELMCAQVLLPAATTDERSLLARLERLESGGISVSPRQANPSRPAPGDPNPHSPERIAPPPQPQPSPPRSETSASAPPAASPAPAAPEGSSPALRPSTPTPAPAASERAAPSSPATSAAAAASAPPRGRDVTADVLRQDWPHVLEMIKAKRRVAWMMLQNASVASLEENVLMLRFPRQGDVKGFTTGQYDELLKQALQARYGVNLVIRAISGPDSGPGGGGGGPRRPAPVAPPAPAPAPEPTPSNTASGSASVREQESAPQPKQPPAPEAPASRRPAPAPAMSPAPAPSTPSRQPGNGQADFPPFPSDDDFYPDDEDMSAPVAVELTGMALIQRELGAEIIGEYED